MRAVCEKNDMPNTVKETINDELALSIGDLVMYLELLEEHVSKDNYESIGKMLKSSPEERVSIARKVLPEDQSGLAHLVLAIELEDVDERKQHYLKSLELSKQHNEEAVPLRFIFGQASAHLANLYWNLNQRDEAIRILEEALNFRFGQHIVEEVRYSLVSYLVILNQDERARAALDSDGIPTSEWYYLNALLRFRQHGDTYISRGALFRAIAEDDIIAYALSDTEYDGDEDELEDLDRWTKKYIAFTREGWKSTPQAMDWLIRYITRVRPRVGLSDVPDVGRIRRIDNEFELAIKHTEREDLKNAKRSFISALREANRLDDGGESFKFIAGLFSSFLKEIDESQSPILELIRQRISWLDGQTKTAEPEAQLHSYVDAGRVAYEVEGFEESEKCMQKAYEIFCENRSELNSQSGDIILAVLGSISTQKNDFEALEKYMRERISMTEETLGPAHLDVVEQLQYLRFALHSLGKHEEELEVAKRAYAIDINADIDEELDVVDWCDVE